jgi:CRP-like cAMP-binding protein
MGEERHSDPSRTAANLSVTREGNLSAEDLLWKLKKSYPFFADMSHPEIVHLLRFCERQLFPAGSVIFRRGNPGEDFYLILSGAVIILSGDKEFARLGAGECFGEMGVIEGAPRSATAKAAEKTLLLRIDPRVLAGHEPALSCKLLAKVARQLSVRLREANEKLWRILP